MAIFSILVGGIIGFASFLLAFAGFGADLLTALAVYVVVALSVSAGMIAVASLQRRLKSGGKGYDPRDIAIRAWDEDALIDQMCADEIRENRQKDVDSDSRVA